MMFKARFHPGIADGSITRTYRYWKRPQAKVGGTSKVAGIGSIEITRVEVIDASRIRTPDARKSGFGTAAELRDWLDEFASDDRDLYRVDFKFVGKQTDREPDRSAVKSVENLEAIDNALALRDKNSRIGPWTKKTLELVGRYPGLRSKDMAERLGREQKPLKQDMRKLKQLGLTISLETGYKLSAKGESWLKARIKPAKRKPV